MNYISFRIPFDVKMEVIHFCLSHNNISMSKAMRRLVALLLEDETIQKRVSEGEDL